MNPTARLLVFDLDGTLVDSLEDIARAANGMLARVAPGTPLIPIAAVQAFVGNGARQLVERTLAAAGLPDSPDDALPVYLDCYRQGLLDHTRLYPGVAEALDRLRPHRLAVLTNKPGDMSRAILEGLGVANRFLRIWGGGDVPGRKPDPAGLLRLMAELEARPAETVLVGDSAVDMRTGRAAGVRTIGVTYGFDPQGLAEERPDVTIADLRALPEVLDGLAG